MFCEMSSRIGCIQSEMSHHISGALLSWNTKKTAYSEKDMGTTKQQE